MEKVYSSLPLTTSNSIRILDLFPGPDDTQITCGLRVASLDDPNLNYDCLSYTWGSTEGQQQIICNGQPMEVTKNLYSFLVRDRSINGNGQHWLWIDAVCINQKDTVERASQVKIMSNIYQRAREVRLDLGEAPENILGLFSLMHQLEKVLTEHLEDEMQFDATDFARLGLPQIHAPEWVAWQEMLSRPYFSRAWVVQEFAIPKNIYIFMGTYGFPVHAIPWLLYHMERHGFVEEYRGISKDSSLAISAAKGKISFLRLQNLRNSVQGGQQCPLIPLLSLLRFCQATDPKDKIFAILGVVTDIDLSQPGMEISYSTSESVAQLYTRVAGAAMASNARNVIELLWEGGSALHPRLPDLPSWVPDWSVTRAGTPLGGLYSAGYSCGEFVNVEFNLNSNSTVLKLKAIIFDTIWKTSNPHKPHMETPRTDVYFALNTYNWINSARAVCNALTDENYVPTGQVTEEAFWRTLIGDKTHTDLPATEAYSNQWKSVMIQQRFIDEALRGVQLDENGDMPGFAINDPTGEYTAALKGSRLYHQALHNMVYTRSFCLSQDRYMAMVPGDSKPGDAICIVAGSMIPFIIRKMADGMWTLLGDCYVHGITRGELVPNKESLRWEMISIA